MTTARVGYLLLFGGAAVACYAATWRATDVSAPDTRTGLVALLLFSGTWATASFGRLLPVSRSVQVTFYMIGLVVGLASVGGWLYFCSAYAGHDYHRRPAVRMVGLVVFLVVTIVKLTNPLHHQYFATSAASTPFPHMVIELNPVHWVVTGVAYALSAVGFYLLYELFSESRFDTRPLAVLVGAMAVPAVFDVLAYTEVVPGVLLKFNYEPVGVAVFAVGALYVVDETFVAVPRFWRRQVLERLSEAIVVTDYQGQIRDYNDTATGMFPSLSGAMGSQLSARLPALADTLDADGDLIELERDGTVRYYRVRVSRLSFARNDEAGRAIICADVTDIERQRRDLQRQTDQFDEFAEAISHELRNVVTVIDGYLELVAENVESDREPDRMAIDRVSDAADRMQEIVTDLTLLARYGRPPEALEECDLEATVEAAREEFVADGLTCEVTSGGSVAAERGRLTELFRNAFRFARANGAARVTVAIDGDHLVVTGDGSPLDRDTGDRAIAYGEPVPSADTGMTLPNVRILARAHGWEVSLDPTYTEGVRIRLEGVELRRRDEAD